MASSRWVIEELKGDDWDTAGWVDAPTAAAAVALAAKGWDDVRGVKLRAILWEQATAEQQSAAEYERNLRIELHEMSGAPGTFADQWVRGELSLAANTPARATAYHQAVTARRGIGIGIATLAVAVLLAVFARPSLPTLLVGLAVFLVGVFSSYTRARQGLLEPGNEAVAKKTPFGPTAFILPGSLAIAFMQGSWIAAATYVAAFFVGVFIGILVSEYSR